MNEAIRDSNRPQRTSADAAREFLRFATKYWRSESAGKAWAFTIGVLFLVILNLAVWFALHVLFAETQAWPVLGLTLDVPRLASINLPSLVLTLGAILAVFRLKAGMIPVLAACSILGVLYYLGAGRL